MNTLNDAPTREQLIAFLDGSGTIDGVSFGERHPVHAGLFWWRKFLTILDRANTPDSSAAQGAMTDEQAAAIAYSHGIWSCGAANHLDKEILGKFARDVIALSRQPSDATAQPIDEITRLTLELQNANELIKHWRSLANTAQGKTEHIEYDLELAKRIVRDNFHKALAAKKG